MGDLRVEIKTARLPQLGETMGWFGRKKGGQRDYPFDIAVFVELDINFHCVGTWHMGAEEVKMLEDTETST